MKVKVLKSNANGVAKAPPSKSFAHRLLICSALSKGTSIIKGVSDSQDMLATLNCVNSLGASYTKVNDSITISLPNNQKISNHFYCNESGSTLRFFIPLALAFGGDFTFHGTEKLISRGVDVYKGLFLPKGIKITTNKTSVDVSGKLTSGQFDVLGNVSSQFITGLLFALPLIEGDSILNVIPPIESQSYIDITLQVLNKFGIKIDVIKENSYKIYGGQKYIACNSIVEGDWSNSAFLYALSFLGHNVKVEGLACDSLQGDKACLEIFNKISKLTTNQSQTDIIDLSNCPDLAPISFAVASCFNGAVFTGTKRLAIKESDRAKAMQSELAKFGIKLIVEENSVKVLSGKLMPPTQTLFGHNDHRIVMALTILATLTGAEIEDAQAIAKSYPNFFEVLRELGVKIIK